jgi:hypothetical protein
MPEVFVSHAAADSVLVDPFVDTVLKLGCGLDEGQIFYSSGEDTGVPSGSDLLHHVREQVAEAGLVVAIISPIFQTRPVCVAELGAAWSRTGNLFPLAVPGMSRTDMEGVLSGMTVRFIDDPAALDELHERVGAVAGAHSKTTTWGRHKAAWMANVEAHAKQLSAPDTVTLEELQRTRDELAGTQGALVDSEGERRKLQGRIERFAAATSAEERAEALLPEDERERFEALMKDAAKAVEKLDGIVGEALFFKFAEGSMPWPHAFDDHYRNEAAKNAVRNGDLVEDASEQLVPDDEVTDVARAIDAVTRLRELFEYCSEEFDAWFRDEYGGPPDLRKRRIWDKVVG